MRTQLIFMTFNGPVEPRSSRIAGSLKSLEPESVTSLVKVGLRLHAEEPSEKD